MRSCSEITKPLQHALELFLGLEIFIHIGYVVRKLASEFIGWIKGDPLTLAAEVLNGSGR